MLCLMAVVVWIVFATEPTVLAVENMRVVQTLGPGDPIGAFRVTKIGGAVEDGVAPGEDLCYRCRYGSRPMVLIFARKSGPGLVRLAQRLDAAIDSHRDTHVRGLLTFIGDQPAELSDAATKFVSESEVRCLPIVVAEDAVTGPIDYRIPESAAVTVIVASDSQVVQTNVFTVDTIDADAVLKTLETIVR
jgi:hypothetical protein